MRTPRTFDYTLLGIVVAIVLFGLLMLTSASSVLAFERYGDGYYLIKRQLLSTLIGFGGLWFFSRFDYRLLRSLAFFSLLISIGLLVVVLIPGIGTKYLGAQRWISVGPIFFQPSEVVKLTFLIYLATWLDRRRVGGSAAGTQLQTFLILLGLTGGLILLEPDMGTMLILGVMALAVYFVSGASYRHMAIIGAVGLAVLLVAAVVAPYRLQRLMVFFQRDADTLNEGYHIHQSLLAIGSGGLLGVGLGHSRQKFNYLPEAHGDSIFAVIAEELGFLIASALIVAYVTTIMRGFRIAQRASDPFGRSLAAGIATWLAAQVFLNIGALSGIFPLTGIPLPLISYGGTALIILLSAVGILLSISRTAYDRTAR